MENISIIWYALGIPFLASIFVLLKYKRLVVWWEFLIPFAISVALILIFKYSGNYASTRDTEYWGNYVHKVSYYEPWNEYIYKTCTESYLCGFDTDGNAQWCTRSYPCNYVKDHPARYTATDNSGSEFSISQGRYTLLKKRYQNVSFVDLKRNYHSYDGDKYVSVYDGSYEKYEFIASKHTYTNKVQVSRDTLSFPEVSEEDVKAYGLYNYPEISGFHKLPAIIGDSLYQRDYALDKRYDWLNGVLGMKKQLRVCVLLFQNYPIESAYFQEAYWKGGNKNEFNLAIGIDDSLSIQWCYAFTWSETAYLKQNAESVVKEMRYLDLSRTCNYLYEELNKRFVRKSFSDFDKFITIHPPLWAIIVTYITTLIASILTFLWAVKNKYTS